MRSPLQALAVWIATQIIMLFVILDFIPREFADVYIEMVASGLTYLVGAATSIYYLKRLHDSQKLPHIPKETIEEILKKGVAHIPYPHHSQPPSANTTASETIFHESVAVFSQEPEIEKDPNNYVVQNSPETIHIPLVDDNKSTNVTG